METQLLVRSGRYPVSCRLLVLNLIAKQLPEGLDWPRLASWTVRGGGGRGLGGGDIICV